MVTQLEPFHPQHPHNLECPHCGRHTVVIQGESRYVCLNCNWRRDIAEESNPWAAALVAILGGVALLLIL